MDARSTRRQWFAPKCSIRKLTSRNKGVTTLMGAPTISKSASRVCVCVTGLQATTLRNRTPPNIMYSSRVVCVILAQGQCYTMLCTNPSAPMIVPCRGVPHLGHDLPKVSRTPAHNSSKFASLGQSAQIRSTSIKVGRHRPRPESGRSRPKLADWAPIWPKSHQNWPSSTGFDPNLAEVGPTWARATQICPTLARIRSNSAEFRPSSDLLPKDNLTDPTNGQHSATTCTPPGFWRDYCATLRVTSCACLRHRAPGVLHGEREGNTEAFPPSDKAKHNPHIPPSAQVSEDGRAPRTDARPRGRAARATCNE